MKTGWKMHEWLQLGAPKSRRSKIENSSAEEGKTRAYQVPVGFCVKPLFSVDLLCIDYVF